MSRIQILPSTSSGPGGILTNKWLSIHELRATVGKVQGMVGKQGGVSNSDQVVKGIADPKAPRSDSTCSHFMMSGVWS